MIHNADQAKYIAHELTKRHATDNVEKSASFDQPQAELSPPIAEAMTNARPLPPVAIDFDYAHAPNMATLERATLQRISERNTKFFKDEIGKLKAWADDGKAALDEGIKAFDRHIQEARRAALAAVTLEQKLAVQKAVKILAKERKAKRCARFETQDAIDAQRNAIITDTGERMAQTNTLTILFTIRWRLLS